MTVAASNYERVAGETYFTPAWATEALLLAEPFQKVWDPAGGNGGITLALPADMICFASDIAPDSADVAPGDFFDAQEGYGFDIVTNPPYGVQSRLAVRFIQHSLALTKPYGGKVAMLLKVGFDSAPGRHPLFRDHPAFAAEYRLTRRVMWTNLPEKRDGKGRLMGPTEHHSWFVWDWRKRSGPAVKGYLPLEATNG